MLRPSQSELMVQKHELMFLASQVMEGKRKKRKYEGLVDFELIDYYIVKLVKRVSISTNTKRSETNWFDKTSK